MTTRHEIDQRMTEGYRSGGGSSPARRSRAERVAAGFRPDERAERLLRLRVTDPAAFAALPAATTMGLGFYENARAAAAAVEGGGDHA